MSLIYTHDDYIRYLTSMLRDSRIDSVAIASYNIQAGVSHNGKVFPSPTYRLLDLVNREYRNSRILIGFNEAEDRGVRRAICSAEFWRKIDFRYRRDSHLKCWIFYSGRSVVEAVCGGRNLGDSEWADVSIVLDQRNARSLAKFYDSLWNRSQQVKPEAGIKLLLNGRPVGE